MKSMLIIDGSATIASYLRFITESEIEVGNLSAKSAMHLPQTFGVREGLLAFK